MTETQKKFYAMSEKQAKEAIVDNGFFFDDALLFLMTTPAFE